MKISERFKGDGSMLVVVKLGSCRLLNLFAKSMRQRNWPQICRAENISEIETHSCKVC